jgi:hypothetical protein
MKKALVLGVAAVALIAFSGMAAGSVYMQYWEVMNSNGWIYYGELVPDYTFYGKYNYNDHMVWKEFDGEIYVPTHENWHINWDTKTLYMGKPCLILHYNFMYHLEFTPKRSHYKVYGYMHLTDPAAADPATQWYLWYPGLTPIVTKWKGGPLEPPKPTIEDTTLLMDWIFEKVPYDMIPLIDRMDFGNVQVSVSLL